MIGAGAVSAHDFTVLVTPIYVAIDSVDFNESLERESNDRPFELTQFQNSLVNCVLDANPNTIVLFNAGSNVDMSHWQQRARPCYICGIPDRKAVRQRRDPFRKGDPQR